MALRGLPTLPISKNRNLRQAILDENEYYESTEGILYGAGIAD